MAIHEVSPAMLFRAYESSDVGSDSDEEPAYERLEGQSRVVHFPLQKEGNDHREIIIKEDILPGCGGRTWEAAFILTSYLVRNPHLVRGKRVLELGCGTGVVGLVAAGLAARDVVLTDLECMLDVARASVELNRATVETISVPNALLEEGPCPRVTVRELAWGCELDSDWWNYEVAGAVIPSTKSNLGTPSTRSPEPFDVVLAADCVYLESCFEPLRRTLLDLTGHPHAIINETGKIWEPPRVLIGYKKRWKREKRFWTSLRKDFHVEIVDDDARPTYEREGLVIYSLTRKLRK
ncbi:hypothetical protein HDU93_000262 [Gonapodya sp. JEL0774]|nr:hypothetical protein HDU93_000262 [Gonapodya sp. JEL0774]